MAEGGLLSFAGDPSKTLRDYFEPNFGGLAGNEAGTMAPGASWLDAAATANNLSVAQQMGARMLPQVGRQVLSGGPEGGWFPGDAVSHFGADGGVKSIYSGYNAPAGIDKPSTNNWRLLPQGYNTPQYYVRNGHIIDKNFAPPGQAPLLGNYVSNRGGGDVDYGRGGYNYPASSGRFQADWGLFWPGQIEPWEYSIGTKG